MCAWFHWKQMLFCGSLVLVSWQAFISSIVMKLDFVSQPSSKSTLPFAGLQHMQQCQVNFHSIFASMLWSKWMVHEKWSPQWGFEPTTFQSWVFCQDQQMPLTISNLRCDLIGDHNGHVEIVSNVVEGLS